MKLKRIAEIVDAYILLEFRDIDIEINYVCNSDLISDLLSAGVISCELRSILADIGIPQDIIRRAAIATFEAEMDVIIHAIAGTLHHEVTEERKKVIVTDMGPGIPDIEQAMQEGFSTAPDWVREMGWGAGMRLPSIKKCRYAQDRYCGRRGDNP